MSSSSSNNLLKKKKSTQTLTSMISMVYHNFLTTEDVSQLIKLVVKTKLGKTHCQSHY